MEFLLIGANYGHQMIGCKYGNPDKFAAYLGEMCRLHQVNLIAEGANESTLSIWSASESVGRTVARNMEIRHLFCEPDFRERERLGIPSLKQLLEDRGIEKDANGEYAMWSLEANEAIKQDEKSYWPIRQQEWLRRVLEVQSPQCHTCAFLLGTDHVDAFSQLLNEHGLSNEVLCKRWEP